MERDSQIEKWWRARQDGMSPKTGDEPLSHELDRIWEETAAYGQDFVPDTDRAWQSLQGKLRPARTRRLPMLRRMAAAVVLLVGLGILISYFIGPAETPMVTAITAAGQQREIRLPDGTTVVLNEESRLSYPEKFAGGNRLVTFEGEGFFRVASDASAPFLIELPSAEVRVLGTAFNVRAYPEEGFSEVEVAEGRVEMAAAETDRPVRLQARQCGLYRDGSLQVLPAPHLNRQAWRTHRLQFRSTPLSEVTELLERYYSIELEDDAVTGRDCTVSGNWQEEDLSNAMRYLEALTGLQTEKTGERTWRLSGKCR